MLQYTEVGVSLMLRLFFSTAVTKNLQCYSLSHVQCPWLHVCIQWRNCTQQFPDAPRGFSLKHTELCATTSGTLTAVNTFHTVLFSTVCSTVNFTAETNYKTN